MNWTSVRACVKDRKEGEVLCLNFFDLTENACVASLWKTTSSLFPSQSEYLQSAWSSHARKTAGVKRCNRAEIFNIFWQLSAADLCVLLVLIYMKVLNSYFFSSPPLFFKNSLFSHFWFSDGQLAGDSWAYFHLPNTKTALGPPCFSLIIHIQARASWQVCWSHSMFCDLDNTFSLCGQKMLRPSHFLRLVLWDSTEAEARNYSSSVRVMLVSESGWSQISRQSNRDRMPVFSILIWAKHCFI